ncbi:MAG TPA: ABC transporter permease [Bdellovibrionota bacterium]|jgi:peptide/nickel transport system permease protein|nr:ABC transporter permease [Bdellovibrionota bacterium]
MIRRTLYGIPIIFGATLILFFIFNIVPGDPAVQLAGKHATPEAVASIRHELGLDRPMYAQYFEFVKQTLTLDFGRSYSTKQDIMEMFWYGAGTSLSLILPPFLITVIVSLLFGALVAYYRATWIDKSIVALSVAGQSISMLAYVLAFQYFFAYKWNMFPVTGYDTSWVGRWQYLTLPGLIYIAVALSPFIRFYRTIILDEFYQDYVRTARAKGLTEKVVMLKHVMKNAMIPVITDLLVQLPFLILGSLILEKFFSIPGLGDITVRAITDLDRPVIMAVTVLGTIAFVVLNILSDILYALVDPRVKVS